MSRLRWSAALVLPLLLLAAPAHAERWSAADPAGDVTGWHYDPEPAPCGTLTDLDGSTRGNEDIVAFSAQHNRRALRLVVRFQGLDAALEQSVSFRIQTPTRAWELGLDRWAGPKGKFRVETGLTKAPPEPPDDLGECDSWGWMTGVKPCRTERSVDFATSTIAVTVPRSCIGDPAWVRVGASASAFTDYEPPAASAPTTTCGAFPQAPSRTGCIRP